MGTLTQQPAQVQAKAKEVNKFSSSRIKPVVLQVSISSLTGASIASDFVTLKDW